MFPFIDLGFMKLPAYGLCMVLGIYLAAGLMLLRTRRTEVRPEYLIIIQVVCVLSFMVGAKVFSVFATYSPMEIFTFVKNGDFEFFINSGLVFYGGLIFGILGAVGMSKILKVDLFSIEGHIVPFIPLGHAIGRIGCLMAGCCYGMRYEGPLAVHYPDTVIDYIDGPVPGVGYFPVQLMEAVLNLSICIALVIFSRKKRRRGDILFLYLLMYAIMRFCTELFRGDAVRGIYFNLSTSQWISIVLIIVFLIRKIIIKLKIFNYI